jgi:hypothetical protein
MTIELSPPRFVLPGSWSRVDLTTVDSMKVTVRRIVDDAVGRQDERARLRAELRKAIIDAATPARDRGAIEFHFARELTEGVPLSATLAVFLVPADLGSIDEMPASAIDMVVADAVMDSGSAKAVPVSPGIKVTRTASRRRVPERNGVPSHEIVEADYWISASSPARIAVLSFSTALAELEDDMLTLFNAIVQTVRWDVAGPERGAG